MATSFDDIRSMIQSILHEDDAKPEVQPDEPQEPVAITSAAPEPTPEPVAEPEPTMFTPDLPQGFDPEPEPELNGHLTPDSTNVFADTADRQNDLPLPDLPTFTTDEIASAIDIRNFATLVTLNTARWHAKVKDRQASKNAAQATGADERAFETHKRLLVGADAKLKKIHKELDAARSKFYEMTLPWTTKGVNDLGRRTGARMLPNTLFFDFTAAMAQAKQKVTDAVDDFEPEYPMLIEEAKRNLGGSFNIAEYPNADSIRKHFDISFDFQPIPDGSDFKGLPQQQIDALAEAIRDKTALQIENAMHDLWTRLHDTVQHTYERLSDPSKTFHHTLVENIRTMERLLGHLNITNDKRVEELREYIAQHLCVHDNKELKSVARAEAAAHAKNVLDMMDNIAKRGVVK